MQFVLILIINSISLHNTSYRIVVKLDIQDEVSLHELERSCRRGFRHFETLEDTCTSTWTCACTCTYTYVHMYVCIYIYIYYVTYNICKYVYIHSKNLLKSHWADSQKRKTLRVVTRRVLGSDMSAADNTNRQLEHFHVTTIWKRWRVDRCWKSLHSPIIIPSLSHHYPIIIPSL